MTSDRFPVHRPAAKVIFGREFIDRGHTVDWLLRADESATESGSLETESGTMYVAPTDSGASRLSRLRKRLYDFRNDLQMLSLVRRNHYDIIQVKDKYVAGLIALIASWLGKTALCYWIAYPQTEADIEAARRGTARYRWLYWIRGQALRTLLYKLLLAKSDHVFVQSEQMKRDFSGQGVPLERMTAVPGSLDLAEVPFDGTHHSEKLDLGAGGSIVYLGTLIRLRRLSILISALQEVRKTHPDARLFLLGRGEDPEDEAELRAEATRLGLARAVVFVGHLPMIDAYEYIRAANVCVSPYYPTPILNSTSPTKLIEYMAMGKPVVGNSHPEQSFLIEQTGAGLCVEWDAIEFGEAITRILDEPEAWLEKASEGRAFVKRERTNKVMASIVETGYAKAIESFRRSQNAHP